MPLDPYSYVAASRVKTLLCPVGRIRRSSFFQYADRLSKTFEVRLVDVTPDSRSDRSMFSPLGYPNGKVIYDFSLSAPDEEENFALYDLEPYRQTFVVFGLASFKDTEEGHLPGEAEYKALKQQYKNAILHKILVFGVPDEGSLPGTKNIVPILSAKAQSFTSLETVMCDITSEFLAELAVYTISRQMGSFKSPMIKDMDSPNLNSVAKRSVLGHAAMSRSASGSLTKTGSISLGLTDRSQNRQRGRQQKFTGNMFLLAGKLPDALRELSEAASISKATYDHLWHASALDAIGACLVFMSFLEVPITIPPIALSVRLKGSHPAVDSTPSLLSSANNSTVPDEAKIAAMVAAGASSPAASSFSHSATSSTSSLPSPSNGNVSNLQDFLAELVDGVLRFYMRGQGEETVPKIVYSETILRFLKLLVILRLGGGWNGASLSAIVRGTSLNKNINSESPSKSSIILWCNKLYSTGMDDLNIGERCRIYSGLASVYQSADMPRKHAFILRELMLILIGEEKRSRSSQKRQSLQSHERKDSEHSIASQATSELTDNLSYLSILDNSYEHGLLGLLDRISAVYGAGDINIAGCGWSTLKHTFLRTAIISCELTRNYAGTVRYISTLLATSADVLGKEEQLKLFSSVHRAIDHARQAGDGSLLADYFDPYLLRSITKLDDSRNSLYPIDVSSISEGDDVFIYNPFAKQPKAENQYDLIVQRVRVDFMVKLQNPFEFEVHLTELSLLTNDTEGGEDLECSVKNVYLPPNSVTETIIPVIANSVGKLEVFGIKTQASNCRPRDYYLTNNLIPRLEDKIKVVGVESGNFVRSWQNTQASNYSLVFNVLHEQPSITVKGLSIDSGWMTLFEGEIKNFDLELSNFSDVSANYVNVSFSDSTTDALQEVLTHRDISENDTYECEYFLYKRKAFQLDNDKNITIKPHSIASLNIRVLGKRGLQSGVINIDYGHISKESKEKTIWTKRLSIPIHVTVTPSIELGGCSIIPMPAAEEAQSFFLPNMNGPASSYHVLVLDFRNSWTEPIKMKLWSKPDETSTDKIMEITHNINGAEAKRFLLPIKWGGKSPSLFEKPIPSLTGKQFVLNSKSNTVMGKQMRETFWYREELLKLISGEWELSNNPAVSGKVELRGLRVSPSMVMLLRAEQIKITIQIEDVKRSKSLEKVDANTWKLPLEYDGCAITASLQNMTDKPIKGILRLVPSMRYSEGENEGMNKKLLYNGWLQQPIRKIEPGSTAKIQLGIVYIAKGEYQWTSVFDMAGPDGRQLHGQKVPLYIKVD